MINSGHFKWFQTQLACVSEVAFSLQSKPVGRSPGVHIAINQLFSPLNQSGTPGPLYQPWCQGWIEELVGSLHFNITV